jgi:tellurite resistance protein TerC
MPSLRASQRRLQARTWPGEMMTPEILHQLREAIPVVLSLILIEGLLSVDNMLAIAALANQLPEPQKKKALRIGLAGAYVFRIVALFFAGFIIANPWVKFLGAFYLIHLMAEHFSHFRTEDDPADEKNDRKPQTFFATITAIQLMDLSLSVDNVVAAVAMSPDIRVVCLGVCLGLLTLLLFASYSLKLLEKFPILEHTAFLLIGYVGLILLTEMTAVSLFHAHLHISAIEKFIGIGIITLLSLLYHRSPFMQQSCRPLFRVLRLPLQVYAKLFGGLIGLVIWPFKQAITLFSGRSS